MVIINDETGEAFKSPEITMAVQALAKHRRDWKNYTEMMNKHRLQKEVIIEANN